MARAFFTAFAALASMGLMSPLSGMEAGRNVVVSTPAELRAGIRELGPRGGTIELAAGDWRFGYGDTTEMSFYISNHDQSPSHKVNLPLAGCTNLTLKGNGNTLYFHADTIASAVIDSRNVRIENLKFDLHRPALTDAEIVAFDAGGTVLKVDRETYPWTFRKDDAGRTFFAPLVGGKPMRTSSAMVFDGRTGEIVERTADVGFPQPVTDLGDGTFRVAADYSKSGRGAKVGDYVCIRPYGRFCPSMVAYRTANLVLEDFVIHSASGMGLIAQMCDGVVWRGTKRAEDKTSGTFLPPSSRRMTTLHADSSHFSNVKGQVVVENCYFEAMMDDALNVHSTCLGVVEKVSPRVFRCRYMHPQAVGFGVFNAGDTARFIKGKTLENGFETTVAQVEEISFREVLLTFSSDVPSGYGPGDAVENADYQPHVVFRGNVVANNRARGILVTTPKGAVVEDNKFLNVSGTAILLAGDAQGWYESGACKDVTVRRNLFRNCLTSRFQFCDGIISIYPMVRDLAAQKTRYHKDISISDNIFETFDVPLLYAISADGIAWKRNKLKRNALYKGWGREQFILSACENVAIGKGDSEQ